VAGRKIEGLAIRESKKAGGSACRELVIGLRVPTDKVRAFVVDITATPSSDAELELKPLFTFDALCRVRHKASHAQSRMMRSPPPPAAGSRGRRV
jgi:hypothetical protein